MKKGNWKNYSKRFKDGFSIICIIRAEQEQQLQEHIKEIEDKYENKRTKAMEKLVSQQCQLVYLIGALILTESKL